MNNKSAGEPEKNPATEESVATTASTTQAQSDDPRDGFDLDKSVLRSGRPADANEEG